MGLFTHEYLHVIFAEDEIKRAANAVDTPPTYTSALSVPIRPDIQILEPPAIYRPTPIRRLSYTPTEPVTKKPKLEYVPQQCSAAGSCSTSTYIPTTILFTSDTNANSKVSKEEDVTLTEFKVPNGQTAPKETEQKIVNSPELDETNKLNVNGHADHKPATKDTVSEKKSSKSSSSSSGHHDRHKSSSSSSKSSSRSSKHTDKDKERHKSSSKNSSPSKSDSHRSSSGKDKSSSSESRSKHSSSSSKDKTKHSSSSSSSKSSDRHSRKEPSKSSSSSRNGHSSEKSSKNKEKEPERPVEVMIPSPSSVFDTDSDEDDVMAQCRLIFDEFKTEATTEKTVRLDQLQEC